MRRRIATLFASAILSLTPFAPARSQEASMSSPRFVVLKHMTGTLALAISEISGVWFRPATADQAAQVRVNSPALTDAKTLGGDEAVALWRFFSEGPARASFLLVSHQGGTLAVPLAQIRSAFYSDQGGARLRLVYDGDPSGKVVEGDEATSLWRRLSQ